MGAHNPQLVRGVARTTRLKGDTKYETRKNGLVGFEMTLAHNNNCEFNLTDNAHVAEYSTSGNTTKIIIVTETPNELFTSTSDFEILDLLVGNAFSEINANIVFAPKSFGLSNAYPNPFNPVTSMTLDIPEAGNVTVQVYNIMGQIVATLASGHMDANTYTLTWDASNVSSGMYFLKAEANGNIDTQKLMLIK